MLCIMLNIKLIAKITQTDEFSNQFNFNRYFQRTYLTKKYTIIVYFMSSSRGGIRTHDQLITLIQ